MSKYVKELMMDQLRSDLDGSRSLLIVDLKDLDAIAEHELPPRPAQEVDPAEGAEELAGPPRFLRHGHGWALEVPGRAPRRWSGAARGSPSWPRKSPPRSRPSRSPQIKGGAVDGVVVGPEQVDDITKLPSREVLIGQVLALLLGPAQQTLCALVVAGVDRGRPARGPRQAAARRRAAETPPSAGSQPAERRG